MFEETDSEEDSKYEYDYSVVNYNIKTRSKSKPNKPNNSKTSYKDTENITGEVVIKNKNYVKKNKRKEFKNVWSRRLRNKLS